MTAIEKDGSVKLYEIIDLTPEVIKEKRFSLSIEDNSITGKTQKDMKAFYNDNFSNSGGDVKYIYNTNLILI